MGYLIISAIFVVLTVALALWVIKLLFNKNWFLGWLRGSFGIVLICAVFIVGSIAYDIYSYKQLEEEQNIATISFIALGEQHYAANFVVTGKRQSNFELHGDQWQLDSRIIEWKGFFARIGLKNGYRLERISGRYLLLDDERLKPPSIHLVATQLKGVDVWSWLKQSKNNSVVNARHGNSTFLPMVDGGQYQISLSESGLLARPLNQPAIEAVEQWR
ncbi:MAG: hypothetical protein ACJAUP_003401 [Cellvibrionaceae bacterium]|jgi:hypothetical protein